MTGKSFYSAECKTANKMFREGFGVDDIQIETGLSYNHIQKLAENWGFRGHAAIAHSRQVYAGRRAAR